MNPSGGEGAEIVYALRNEPTLATLALNNIGATGQPIRQIYQRRLPEDPSKDYYYILRETGNTEPLLVEYGFIDNKADANRLNNNIEQYAEAVVKAIAAYAGYKYTEPGSTTPSNPNQNYYTVQKGDTLYSIARQFGTTVQQLKTINNLANDTITPGMKLFLQENYPEATYTVSSGDTLYSIATRFNTTVQAIKSLNNLTNDTLQIGQELLIPTETTPEIPTTPSEPEQPEETEIYVVKKGDSLWLIAKNNNTTVDELIKLNNLTNINLQIGDELLIPKQPEPTTYTVQKGDTLWSIAKATNSTVDEIKKLNNLTNNLLTVGQQLIPPN